MNKLKRKRLIIGVIALLTLPVSLPYFVIKTIRRKSRKARAIQKIDAADRSAQPPIEAVPAVEKRPLLSIIMPVYNVERFLEASIASVLNQSYQNLELIIVNDASTDGSLATARMFEQMDDRVRVIDLPFNTQGGAGVPSNIGLEDAKGEFVAFFDGDDLLSPYALEKLMHRAVASECDLTIGTFKNLFDDTKDLEKPYDVSTFGEIPSDEVITPREHPKSLLISPVPWRKIYKKSFLDSNKIQFPECDLFYEDNPLHWDVMTAASSMIVVPVTVVYHRMNREGQTMASAAPRLAAYFHHFIAISKRIRKNGGDFAWDPLLKHLDRAHWILDNQSDPALIDQFLIRFNQVLDEHVVPHLGKQHQSALKRVKLRFNTDQTAPDLSVVIYHDEPSGQTMGLARSIASVRALHGQSAEIIVLHPNEPPKLGQEAGKVMLVATKSNATRSFNQALQLCAGRILTFLNSGDELVPSAMRSGVFSDMDGVDLMRYEPRGALDAPGASILLYDRRFVQNNAIFFGPTADGQFSFDTLCSLYAKSVRTLKDNPIRRRAHRRTVMSVSDIENEAGYLLRQLCAAPAETGEIQDLLASVAEFFNESEKAMDAKEIPRLDVVRNQTSNGIARAQIALSAKSAPHAEIKQYTGA